MPAWLFVAQTEPSHDTANWDDRRKSEIPVGTFGTSIQVCLSELNRKNWPVTFSPQTLSSLPTQIATNEPGMFTQRPVTGSKRYICWYWLLPHADPSLPTAMLDNWPGM